MKPFNFLEQTRYPLIKIDQTLEMEKDIVTSPLNFISSSYYQNNAPVFYFVIHLLVRAQAL